MTYPTKKLGEVCEISAGGSAPQGERFFENGKYPFFRTSDVGVVHLSDNLCDVRDYLNDKGIKKLNLFRKGTILFPKSGASTFLNHRVIMGCDGYVASHLATISAGENIDSKFLYYFLILIDAKDIAPNSSYPSLRISDIAKIEIPLPPLAEQKKIVARLEGLLGKIKEAKRLRAEAQEAAQNLLPAELHRIFTQQHSNILQNVRMSGKPALVKNSSEARWEEKELGDESILKMTSGGTPSRSNPSFYTGKIIWLKSGELQDNANIANSEERVSVEAIKNSSAKIFPAGTVLFAMYGATAGKIGILGVEASTNQAVAGMIPVPNKLNNKFLYYFLMQKREEIISQAWGGAQPNLSQTIIKKFKIPLPPVAEQKKIVARLNSFSEKIRRLQEYQNSTASDFISLERSILSHSINSGRAKSFQ